ncbi:D-alanine--poly(phosphoribitol) ligase subunit DltA [Methanobrevibacter sp.]|uniref:D-alanine--poly(phosphoribitol) ligase subunit DltA n=1 Tax=Methanobrevibacter sp. TaxID=66852 RepID=UPI0038642804
MDKEFRRVPIGAVGELYLSGIQLADGYLNRQEETSKAFMTNPFEDNEEYGRLYCTGDVARMLPDGTYGIVGRRDSQVKVRGNRVELSEVEITIRNMDIIEDVTVKTIKNRANHELVAYVVSSENIGDDELRNLVCDYVSENEPEYMVPSFVVRLDAIPLNVNGKVDRSALPDVDLSTLHEEYIAPTNEIERHIVDTFELVFNQKGIGLNDNFIRLGGDSITAIRVISLLEKNDISCNARDILNYKTPYLIAQNVQSIESVSYDAVEGSIDLLPIQEFFFDQINRDNFSQHFILKSNEKLDKDTLQKSFNELCNVHDMLRARYDIDEKGDVNQEILPVHNQICEINEYDISDDIEESLKEIFIKSFNSLNIDNLIEINLIHHNDASYLMLIIHHLIIDGVSWNILITDLTHIYNSLKVEKQISLSRPYPYKNWVDDVKDLLRNISPEEKEHWTKINALLDDYSIKGDANPFAFRVDANYDINSLLMLSEEEYWALAIARAYKKTYSKDIIFNRETYGRDESIAKLNRTIGWFTSQYPILVNVDNAYDDVSLMNDVYNLKTAFKEANNLGLNYYSLIYTAKELEFKPCPVTFNFLSSEFSFKNELFESFIPESSPDYEEMKQDLESYGITFNVVRNGNSYEITGDYAGNTYIGDEFNAFIENIKYELEFIGNHKFEDDNVVCCLSEAQLGIYLDEKVHEKDVAYSTTGILECSQDNSIDEIKDAIHAVIRKHPILKGRVLDTANMPLLICDSYPTVEMVDKGDCPDLIKPFDLDKSLARFFIVDSEDSRFAFYDIHHMISDATSHTIIKNELKHALMGNLDDAIDYGFVYANHDSFESKYDEKYKYAQEFFHNTFADIDDIQYLLGDVNGKMGSVSLPVRGIRENVELFAQNNNITVGSLLNAVFAYTYSRFTGSDKVYYNFTEHGRHEDYMQDAVGMFVRTIPVIVGCENKSVNDYVTDVADLILKSMANSIYPFRLTAREFNLSNDVAFEYNYDLNEFEVGDDIVVRDDADKVSDFLCVVNDLEDGFLITVSHLDKFSQHTATQFVKVFKEVLIQFLKKENLGDIDYISTEDIELLDSYNKTEHPLVWNDILDAFNDNLSKYPENRLVSCNDVSYTYAEGAYVADAIGKKLLELGIKPQECVGFLVPRSELYMFCILSCMSVGAVYVPLDDTLPDERIAFMMKDTDSRVIIASDKTYERAKELSDGISILNISDILKEDIKSLSSLPVVYEDIASILYTSGTTGVPKGVKITRRAILNVATYYGETFCLDSSDVYGLYASIGFDAGVMSIFKAIYSGACLSVVPEEIRYNMYKLNDYFIEQNVTHTIITTPVGKLFMHEIDDSSLDYLFVGGEKLGEIESPKNYQLVDEYGPSEANNFISSINNSDKIHYSSVGKLNYNSKAYILDDEKRRVPCGATGELYLAGYQIADGYLNREEETIKSFVENPFDEEEDYNTLYRTGDLVRVLPDGSLAIVGRRDGQVKVRGNRVELSEVESVIRKLDYVSDVTVQTIKSSSNNELVAYVVLSHEIDDVKDSVCDYVTKYKPDYMVPSFVIELDEIPLNVNGKVNRSALPEVDLESLHDEYVAPANETEKHIAEAFEYVFNQKDIGVNDDFVRLGGDSITAIRVISILEKNDISCTARDILNYKTPSRIAQNVQIVESISYDAVEGTVDLLPIQEYFFDQVTSDKFSQYYILKSNEKLDIDTLQESFNELCNVHDMLRADYSLGENGDVIQEILPINSKICEINEYNISNDFEESIKDIFIKSLNSLDVESNLIEINLIHHKSTSYLMFIIHHLIIDGVSWDILITDLTNIYNNLKAGKEIGLQRPYPYKNWVEDIKNLVNDISPEEKRYWTKINDLLDDSSIKGNANPFIFDVDVNYDIDNLLMLSEEEYLALAIARAYNKTYGKDAIFKRETYGRDESIAKINRTVGWFTSQYPILVDVNNDYSDVSLMNDVYNIKSAFNDANNLGLNYYSLIYTTKELEFKHCPVTFNFLSSEFSFKNELFESIIPESLLDSEETDIYKHSLETYGITFNVFRDGNSYRINGQYAGNTYIGDKFNKFIENIKSELEFIGNYKFKDNNIVCCLSESQLGIYLDEKVHKKGLAYSNPRIFDCDSNYTIGEIEDAIHALIKKHPILKGRVLDTANMPLLICDSYPSIEIAKDENYSDFIKPFDLDKSLAAFIIVDSEADKSIIYNVHHIISDATTATLINKGLELALMGKLDDEIDLGFVYASRDSFEVQYDNKYESAQKFFQDNFADIDEVQYLLRDVDGKIGSVGLPIRGIRENVESFTKKNNITVNNLLNAVFAYTYSRFTGSDKVYYNFTEHGRHEDYLQDAWGMFIRTIPVIVDCENRSVADYVDYTSDLILKSMTNSIYPFRLLAKEFDLNNDVIFEYNHDLNEFEIGDEIVFRDDADGVSDFLCVVNDLEDGFVVSVSHLDKFSQNTAKQFVESYKLILEQIISVDKLEEIDYTANEDIALLDSYNQTEHDLDYEDILDAFNYNLSKHPENKLVEFNDLSYSYAEGAYIVDAIGRRLIDLSVEPQDKVSFLVPRSELYMFCTLGVLSIAGIYVPLDDTHPNERVEFMIKDTDSKVLIVSDETYERGYNLAKDRIILNISDIINGEIRTLNKLDNTYGDLACILYTSGSTGIPKGVKITRKSLVNFIDFHVNDLDILPEDVYGLFASIGFDVAMAAIFSVIYSGACLNVIPNDIKLNISAMNKHFMKHGVTHTYITTQIAKLFISQIDETSLKVLVAGGEKLGQIDEIRNYRIVDAYGPTEACVYVISADTTNKIDYSSVGYVQNNTKAYILDKEFRRVPIGAVGELYLSGIQLADGYLNRQEETSKAFMSNPFENNEEYGGLYCTGDVARLLPDGSYGIIGRRDGQVKIRGNRVELTEIESVIRKMDNIEDVTVQISKNNTNNELVAYVTLSKDLKEDLVDYVREYVLKHKPEYMVPSYVVKLDEIPLNVNGKVDKRALPDVDKTSLHAEYVAPRDENEKEIVEAFEKALKIEKVSIYDDFIHLGGDSLTAIRLLSYITSHDVTMADIFAFRTPEAIAKNMSDYSFDLDIYSLESGCPLNSAQINVFADVNVYNKKNAYHIPGYISIPKEYSLENILESLDKLLDAHPILSMRLSDEYEVNDNIDMSNLDLLKDLMTTAKKYGINEIINLIKAHGADVRGLYNMLRTIIRLFKGEYPYLVKGAKPPISVKTDAGEDNIIDFFSESFDLYNYLSKFLIVENKDSYYLIYWIHHIIFDAISAGVFQKDFMTLLNGGDVAFDDTFLKTSAFTHQIKNTEKFDEAGEFYEPILSNIDDVGVLREDSLPEGYSSSVYDLEFDKAAFKSFLNKAGISENVFFTSIFAYTLSQFSDGDKVLFTMIENGRDRFPESFIGMTSNVMPIIADCKNQSISSFMEQMADTVYEALRYSYYPILLLYQKYNFEVNILFQFIPNWIIDDFNTIDDAESHEIYNKVINSFQDSLTEFLVQVYQNGTDYRLVFTNSNKYSDKMINDFKDVYISVLSKIINDDMSSNLNSIK